MSEERRRGIDVETVTGGARAFLLDGPRTFEEVRDVLAARHPKLDARMMGYAVRTHLPLVQVPGAGAWGFSNNPPFALADAWLGRAPERRFSSTALYAAGGGSSARKRSRRS